jgi:acyl-CoA thioesterase II
MVWLRAVGSLPDDPSVQVCALAHASDMTLLDSVLLVQGVAWDESHVSGASLDHRTPQHGHGSETVRLDLRCLNAA